MLWLGRQLLSLMPTTAMFFELRSMASMTAGSFLMIHLGALLKHSFRQGAQFPGFQFDLLSRLTISGWQTEPDAWAITGSGESPVQSKTIYSSSIQALNELKLM